jgi:hypothetical protein
VPAYWVRCSCMQDKDQVEDDVYPISDVMCGAQSLVIAISLFRKRPDWKTPDAILGIWAERMWTLPKALLSPTDKDIKVYVRGNNGHPRVISKKQLAAVDLQATRRSLQQHTKPQSSRAGLYCLELFEKQKHNPTSSKRLVLCSYGSLAPTSTNRSSRF